MSKLATVPLLILFTGLLLSVATPAYAEGTCRQTMRDLSREVGRSTTPEQGQQAFKDAANARPDCMAEFTTLATWYDSGAKATYPFRAEDDPAKGFLGPIGWWWNIIYVSMFSRNAVLMFLLGWELFLGPIIFALSVATALFGGIPSLFRRGPRHA